MPRKIFSPEQIIARLRQIEVLPAQGKSTGIACKETGISEQTCYRCRKAYGGLRLDQTRRKALEKKNQRLKKRVADVSLDKAMLAEVAKGNFCAPSAPPGGRRAAGSISGV